ncbi:hypothetical protein HOF92_03665 [bacterium]|jgi:hypothetical protein|nr:hypothetical protein [bacterium]
MKFFSSVLLTRFIFWFLVGGVWASSPAMTMKAPKFIAVEEMGSIDGLKYTTAIGSADREKQRTYDSELRSVWSQVQSSVLTNISTKLVQSISRWAKKQMLTYDYNSPQRTLDFQSTLWLDATKTSLLYEATLETLPSHHQLVTRWLKLYLIYQLENQEISTAILTIRGQVLE